MPRPLIIAHRTCPKHAPENSLQGIEKARELGADAVEVDLRMSLDQRPFLMHDWTMRRTTGWPLPLELTPSAIARKQRLEGGEALPSLADVLEALPPAMLLAVDVKTPWAVWALVREARRRGLEERLLAWCTSALAARYTARFAPRIETAYLHGALDPAAKLAFLARASRLGARAVSAHWLAIDEQFVANAHALGLRVYSWHEEHPLDEAKLRSGLDGLITDYPVEARHAVEALPD